MRKYLYLVFILMLFLPGVSLANSTDSPSQTSSENINPVPQDMFTATQSFIETSAKSVSPYFIPAIILIFACALITYLFLRISINKKAVRKKHGWAVSIEIRNKMKELDGVIVRDRIPNGFSMTECSQTIKPVIRKTGEGVELVWRVGRIPKNDVRILNYYMEPLMPFREKYLPSAHLYGKQGERTVQSKSNKEAISGKGFDTKLRVVAK